MLEVSGLVKGVEGLPILRGLSFTAAPGAITGIVGRNGAGKTTLLRTIAGIFTPDAGTVRYGGASVHTSAQARGQMMFVPDARGLLQNETPQLIAQLFALLYPQFDRAAFYGWLDQFQLPVTRKVRHFSKGMKALFGLALAFATRAAVLLLDEPTEGLDPIYQQQALRIIVEEMAEHGPAVLIATHRLDELASIADRVLFLKDGTAAAAVELATLGEDYIKLQAAFADEVDAEAVIGAVGAQVLARSGRVYTLLAKTSAPGLFERLQSGGAVFVEQLPLRLEDLFAGKLGGGVHVG